jgi:hypothetical protein
MMSNPLTSGTSISTRVWGRILVQRFPYCLFYRLDRDGAILIACVHAARDPELGHSRIDDENR